MAKSMRLQLEVDVHAVTCPGVWFPCKSPVYLSICFLGFHVRTKPFPANFPLLFNDKFIFEKTFPGVSTLQQLQATLEHQPLYVELLQEISPNHPPAAQNVLATFETSGLEFLFPYPQLRPTYTSGVDVDLLMEPTRDFPGVIAPRIEASTRTHIAETRNAHLDLLHDNAVTIDQPPPMDRHPNIPSGNKIRRNSSTSDRDVFAWRKYDNLIERTPADDLNHTLPIGPPVPPPGPPGHPGHPPPFPVGTYGHGPPEGVRGRSKSFSFAPERNRSRESASSSGSTRGRMPGRNLPPVTPPGIGPPAPPHHRPISASPPPRRPPHGVHRDFCGHHPPHPPHRHADAPLPVPPPIRPPVPPHHAPPQHPPTHPPPPTVPPNHHHSVLDIPHHHDPHIPPALPPTHLPHLPPPPPNFPPSYHPHHIPADGPHHHYPPHEFYHGSHGAHCLCGRDHQHPPLDRGFYHHPTCPPGCAVNHCHPYPLCLDPITCPYSCHVETHPHYPLPPSSTPHIHSRNFPHQPHPACYDGVCCHS